MTSCHRIRLRGPWEVEAIEPAGRPPTRMTLPCTWRDGGWVGFRGRVRHRRLFGKPRQQDALERIWLVVESITGNAEIVLNGHRLGAVADAYRGDVTDLLLPRNCLEIDVSSASDAGGVTGEVALEIVTEGGG